MRIFLGISVVAVVLTFHTRYALAQEPECNALQVNAVGDAYFKVGAFDLNRPFECQATKQSAPKFAGYYAPYAIQAALSYASDRQILGGSDNFGDPSNVEKAKRIFRQWEYQFDSSDYVICAKPGDKNCYNDQPDRWTSFSTDGLYYQVWARRHANQVCSEFSIAFRGTVNSSVALALASWSSNAHRISRFAHVDDEYDQLVRRLDAVIEQIKQKDCYKKAKGNVQIVSVGHSLGGGLAEFAALATKAGRIRKVFTFNSSPITAPDLIPNQTWQANRQRLTIDRVYQEGEVLTKYSAIRDSQQTPAFECDPLVRTVQINAFMPGKPQTRFQRIVRRISPSAFNAYEAHGIVPLASKLVEWTDERQSAYPPLPTSAHTTCVPGPDYQMLPPPPAPQEVAAIGGAQTVKFGFGRATVQNSRPDDQSAQRVRQTYGFTKPSLMAAQPFQFGSTEPDMAERRVSLRTLVRTRHRAAPRFSQATIQRAHTVSS
jgi:pimeloyl-ACP methyl ester carboxylesterase